MLGSRGTPAPVQSWGWRVWGAGPAQGQSERGWRLLDTPPPSSCRCLPLVGFAACSAVSDLMASAHHTALWRLQPAPPAPLLHARLPCLWLDTGLQGGPAAAQRPSTALPTPSALAPSGGETRLCTLGCGFFAPFLTPRPVWAAPVLLPLSCSSCLCLFQFFKKEFP